MALLDWFNRALKGDYDTKLEFAPNEEKFSGLNLRQVLDAHTAWKSRLQQVLDGNSTEDMDVATVSQDDQCVLGKWIYGEGKHLYGHLPEYESLRVAHADFHLCSGEVLIAHQSGDFLKASQILHTQFRTTSNKNQLELVRLFHAAKVKS
jgi:hypothetical protein